MLAQLRPSYESGLAQFRTAWEVSGVVTTIVAYTDTNNVSPTLSNVTNASSQTPTIWCDARAAAGAWRHFLFAVEGVEGKTPIFQFNRNTNDSKASTPQYLPFWTQDFQTWHQAESRTLVGGSTGYIEWQFTDPLPAGRVYVASHLLGRQADAELFAAELLGTYSTVAAPASSALDGTGRFFTSPAEVDESGRQIGGHPMYAIKLAWPSTTTDGGPKRKLVMYAGIHAGGESQSWYPFVKSVRWMLDNASPEAQAFRANWDVWLYFNLTPNGLYGGNRRTNFQRSTDPNRDWYITPGASELVEIDAVRAATQADNASIDVLISWHGHNSQTKKFIPSRNTYNYPDLNPDFLAFVTLGEAIFGEPRFDYGNAGTSLDMGWGQAVMGAKISTCAEIGTLANSTEAYYTDIGESWIKTVQASDAQGLFYTPEAGGATASGSLPSLALTAPTGSAIGSTVGEGSASGAVASVAVTAPAGTASATASASESGAAPIIVLSAPAGTASGSTAGAANASGVAPSLNLTAPTGSASSTSAVDGIASGLMPAITLTAPTVAPPFVIPAARRRWTNLNGQSRPRYLN